MESLINPLQDRIEDWKKTANQLDKDHAKGWDGMAWLGMRQEGWMGQDGIEWNRMGWDGVEWNGIGYAGMGWDRMEWNRIEWDVMGGNGIGWNRMGSDGMG